MATPFGEKDRCPQCESFNMRAMKRDECVEFHGRDQLVLTMPRLCKACGHGWEVRSQTGGVLMLIIAVIGMLAGLAIMGGAAFVVIGSVVQDRPVVRLRVLTAGLIFGPGLFIGAVYTFRKYWRHVFVPRPDQLTD